MYAFIDNVRSSCVSQQHVVLSKGGSSDALFSALLLYFFQMSCSLDSELSNNGYLDQPLDGELSNNGYLDQALDG